MINQKLKNKKILYDDMTSTNTALLTIDVVNGCCHKNCEEPKWGITFSKIRRMVPKAWYYSDDKTGFSEQFYLVKPQKEDFVFTKNHYDCFTNKDFLAELKEKKIRYIVIAGVFSDGCVLSTIISGFSRGFNFVVLSDLIETTDVKIRQDLQGILKRFTLPAMYGKTVTSKQFLRNIKNIDKK